MKIKLEDLLENMYANSIVDVRDFYSNERLTYGESNTLLVLSRYKNYIVMGILPVSDKLMVEVLSEDEYIDYKLKDDK